MCILFVDQPVARLLAEYEPAALWNRGIDAPATRWGLATIALLLTGWVAVAAFGDADVDIVTDPAFAKYTLAFVPADFASILFLDGATKNEYLAEFMGGECKFRHQFPNEAGDAQYTDNVLVIDAAVIN